MGRGVDICVSAGNSYGKGGSKNFKCGNSCMNVKVTEVDRGGAALQFRSVIS